MIGAGVYVIYYTGKLKCYASVAAKNQGGKFGQPIYIGKAIPKGGHEGNRRRKERKARDAYFQEHEPKRPVEELTAKKESGMRHYRIAAVSDPCNSARQDAGLP